ncbi:MAG: HEAT repeat domain-containing protein [Planctomycetota bacterium]
MTSPKDAFVWTLLSFLVAVLLTLPVAGCSGDADSGNEADTNETSDNGQGHDHGHSHEGGADHGHSHASPEPAPVDDPTSDIELSDETGIDDLLAIIRSVNKTRATEALLQLAVRDIPEDKIEEVSIQIAKSCMDSDDLTRVAAEQAVMEIGEPISQHLGSLMNSEAPMEYGAGCSAVRFLGPEARQWLPQLTEGLNHPDATVRRMALFGLDNFGLEALPVLDRLIELLDDTDFNNQVGVCQVLEDLGIEAAPAEQKLLEVVEEGNLSARSWALVALGAIGPTPDTDVAGLLAERLNAFAQPEKERALMGLAHLGTEASDHLEAIEAMMTDERKRCQPWAAYTYWRVSGDTEKTLESLSGYLSNETYRRAALDMLTKMGDVAAPTAAEIVANLSTAEPDVLEQSLLALQTFGSAASGHEEALEPYLENDDPLIRFHTRKAIASLSGE